MGVQNDSLLKYTDCHIFNRGKGGFKMFHPVNFLDALEYLVGDRKKDIVLAGYSASRTRGDCTFDGYPLQFYYVGGNILPYRCVEARYRKVQISDIEMYRGWKVLKREATIYSMFEYENDDWSIMEMIFEYCDHYNEAQLTNYFKNKGNNAIYKKYLELLNDSRTMYND